MKLRVKAVEGASVSLLADDGAVLLGRFAARTRKGEPMLDGEVVRDHSHYRRALARGDLELVEEVP